MAQNALLPTPVNSEILRWIGRHAESINKTASVLNIPSAAIASGPAEEASHIISVGRSGPSQNFWDKGQDWLASISEGQISGDYLKRKMDIAIGAKPSYALSDDYKISNKIDRRFVGGNIKKVGEYIDAGIATATKVGQYVFRPTKNDVGWGNVNVGVAIFLLDEYLIRTAKGEVFESDPLDLAKYRGRYKALVSDLVDPENDLTFKIAGLAVRRSEAVFADGYRDQYLRLSEKDRVALLVTGYKQGWQQIGRNLEINEVTNGGRPVLNDPKSGDGAPFALRNFDAITGALATGKRRASSLLLGPSASMDRATSQVLSDGQAPSSSPSVLPLQSAAHQPNGRTIPGSNEPWLIRVLGASAINPIAPAVPAYDDTRMSTRRDRLRDPNAPAGIARDDLDGSPPGRLSAYDPAPNAPEHPTAGMASISIVVGAGFPGHTTIQINRGEKATYLGLGPKTAGGPKDVASYDVVTLDKDVSPVAALRKEAKNPGEYHYVDATDYDVKSFTLPISDQQADKAMAAALKYQVKNPKYNGYPVLVGTDYALNVLEAAIPGSDMFALSRIPSILQKELVSLAARGDALVSSRGDRNPPVRTGLTGLQQDEKPPQFNIKQQFNDKVPFDFASGEVGISGQPHEPKAQVSLARASDGSAELSVGDPTFVNFEPGQLASVANSGGKLRLSFSKDESHDKFFGNVMAVDTGTGDVSVLDKHGKLSNLVAGSRINITSAGWDHASEVRPNDLERTAAGFG